MKFRDLTNAATKSLLRMKSGEAVKGIFRGDPTDYRQHWSNNRSYLCTGRDTCELCKAGEKSSFRFRINFVVNENGAYVAKVFEQGKAVYEALKTLHAEYGLDKNQMKITRIGSGTDTQYTILPVANGALTAEQEKAISAVKLIPLTDSQPQEPAEEEEDLPF